MIVLHLHTRYYLQIGLYIYFKQLYFNYYWYHPNLIAGSRE